MVDRILELEKRLDSKGTQPSPVGRVAELERALEGIAGQPASRVQELEKSLDQRGEVMKGIRQGVDFAFPYADPRIVDPIMKNIKIGLGKENIYRQKTIKNLMREHKKTYKDMGEWEKLVDVDYKGDPTYKGKKYLEEAREIHSEKMDPIVMERVLKKKISGEHEPPPMLRRPREKDKDLFPAGVRAGLKPASLEDRERSLELGPVKGGFFPLDKSSGGDHIRKAMRKVGMAKGMSWGPIRGEKTDAELDRIYQNNPEKVRAEIKKRWMNMAKEASEPEWSVGDFLMGEPQKPDYEFSSDVRGGLRELKQDEAQAAKTFGPRPGVPFPFKEGDPFHEYEKFLKKVATRWDVYRDDWKRLPAKTLHRKAKELWQRESKKEQGKRVRREAALQGLGDVEYGLSYAPRLVGGMAMGAQAALERSVKQGDVGIWDAVQMILDQGVRSAGGRKFGEKEVFLTDVFANAMKAYKGATEFPGMPWRDVPLTDGEQMFSMGFGLFSEIMGPGQAYKLLRLGKGKPAKEAIQRHISNSLKKTGKKFAPEHEVYMREQLAKSAEEIVEMPSLPQRIQAASDRLAVMGRHLGASEESIALAQKQFVKNIGPQGVLLEKTGARPLARLLRTKESELVPGSQSFTSGSETLDKALDFFKFQGGAPASLRAELRPLLGHAELAGEVASRQARTINKLLKKGFESDEAARMGADTVGEWETIVARMRDAKVIEGNLKENQKRLSSAMSQAYDGRSRGVLEREMEKQIKRAEASYERLGFSPGEVEAGVKAFDPATKRAIQIHDVEMRQLRNELEREGFKVGEVDGYIARMETAETKDLRNLVLGERGLSSSTKGFTKERKVDNVKFRRVLDEAEMGTAMSPSERAVSVPGSPFPTERIVPVYKDETLRLKDLDISLAGTDRRRFIDKLSEVHANRKTAQAILVANKRAEDHIVRNYASREVVEELTEAEMRELADQGLGVYSAKYARNQGRRFVMDKKTKDLLDRVTSPERTHDFIRAWRKYHAWWKKRATVFRPGFVVRNMLFGNFWQGWLADIDLVSSPALAFAAQARRAGKNAISTGDLLDYAQARNFVKDGTGRLDKIKVGKYSLDEAIELGEKWGVPGGGFFGYEIGTDQAAKTLAEGQKLRKAGRAGGRLFKEATGEVITRPVAAMNRFAEDNYRWALFLDRLKKGYSAREASETVAKYAFNYNELSQYGKFAKDVFSFHTWNWKNWGLQISSALNKPDKLLNFSRLYSGIQQSDPVAPEDYHGQPKYLKDMFGFTLPGKRGSKEGGRLQVIGSGLFPQMSLANFADPVGTIGGMMNPAIRSVFDAMFNAADEASPFKRWGSTPRRTGEYMMAPTLIDWGMKKLMGIDRDVYNAIEATAFPWRNGHHYWPTAWYETLNTLDPAIARSAALMTPKDEQVVDNWLAYLFGIKVHELTQDKKVRNLYEAIRAQGDRMRKARNKAFEAGAIRPKTKGERLKMAPSIKGGIK